MKRTGSEAFVSKSRVERPRAVDIPPAGILLFERILPQQTSASESSVRTPARESPIDRVAGGRASVATLDVIPADCIFPPPPPHAQGTTTVLDRSLLLPGFAALSALLLLASAAVVSAEDPAKKPASVLDFHVKDIDGKDVDLAKYKGKVLLDRQYGQPVRLHAPVQGPRGDLREV